MGTALVSGGAGFIGSHLVRGLLEQGARVRVLDDLSSGAAANLAGQEVELMVADIRDPEAVGRAANGVEWVFHQAAMVSVPGSFENPRGCYAVNLLGSLNVLKAAQEVRAARVVLASSAAVYGESREPIAEDTQKQPLSPYAASKLAMEEAAFMYHRVYGLPVVCLRHFNVYGPRQRPDSAYAAVIPAFIQAMLSGHPPVIYGDGNQRRDFVYVDDVVRANL